MNKINPAIIIGAYDRDYSLKRLLNSISESYFDSTADLIISIDKNDNQKVYDLAHAFEWKHGKKEVLEKKSHLGLKRHILECGDLVEQYDRVILLEDDLFVSPYFYNYAQQCFEYYEKDEKIAGISLYSHRYNETANMGFRPIDDNSDVFFLQIPSSWGQGWTKKQWTNFRNWFEQKQHNPITEEDNVPLNVVQWPESSWKKYFFTYMIETDKYFVYPRISLSTNFSDPGTHHKTKQTRLQVPLLSNERDWKFKPFQESIAVYDAYLEILPEKLKLLSGNLEKYDFEVDFYAQKSLDKVEKELMLTSRNANEPILTFGKELKPIELNIAREVEGSMIKLAKKENCKDIQDVFSQYDISYYYNIPTYFIDIEEHIRNKEEHINQYYYSYYQELETKLNAANSRLSAVYSSKSWKLTVPLRWASMHIQKIFRKQAADEIQLDDSQNSATRLSSSFNNLFKDKGYYSPQEKLNILQKHMVDKVPVTELCEQYELECEMLYDWQKELFENGAFAFQKRGMP